MPPILLAVYGTLRRGDRNHGLLDGSAFLGRGFVRGRLREMPRSDLRAYAFPALVRDATRRTVVEVYALPDAAALAAADALETFDPADEAGSQYVRRMVAIEDGPAASAWIYLYNGPPDEMGADIPGGDWLAHLERTAGSGADG